jgi:hypothetical protein
MMSAESQGVPHDGADERWAPLREAAGYHVSDLGRVANIATGRMLWQLENAFGYCTVRLMTATGRRVLLVHRLVADAFVDNPQAHPEVRHIDGEPTHNQAANLAWGTATDRENDRIRVAWFARITSAVALGPDALHLLEPWERFRPVVLDTALYHPSLADPWPPVG